VSPNGDSWVRPPALGPGAVVGVAAPSGPVDAVRLCNGLRVLREEGLELALAPGLLERDGFLAGGDAVRLEGLRGLLADPGVDAVCCARGGYGAMRLLPQLDLAALRTRPKAVVGFSDVTALHLALGAAGLVSFHGPVLETGTGPEAGASLRAMVAALRGCTAGTLLAADPPGPPPQALHPGRARGRLVGGNLSLLAATLGTPWEVETAGRILLLEDVGEPPYRLDRYLAQLELGGKLQAAAGFLVGEMVGCDPDRPGGPGALDVVASHLLPLGRPCLAGLPLGHGRRRATVPLGALVELDAGAGCLTLAEAATDPPPRRV
jgi:muramoyltetrapeptide carboxypeptidase